MRLDAGRLPVRHHPTPGAAPRRAAGGAHLVLRPQVLGSMAKALETATCTVDDLFAGTLRHEPPRVELMLGNGVAPTVAAPAAGALLVTIVC
jgi:hypothetical protein